MNNCKFMMQNDNNRKMFENAKINLSSIVVVVYSLSVFSNLSYFTWDTYPIIWIQLVVKTLKYLAYFLTAVLGFAEHRKICVTKNKLFCFIMVVVAVLCIHILPENKTVVSFGNLMVITDVFILLFVFRKCEVEKVFKCILIIFILVTLPSTIYYVSTRILNIDLSFGMLQSEHEGKILRRVFYEWRPLGLIITDMSSIDTRACGIFDEPGVIGTFAGLFLAANVSKRPRINLINILLIVEGFLSFSLAFYVLVLLLVIIETLKRGLIPFASLFLILTVFLIGFMSINFENHQLRKLQSRFDISGESETIVVNNRYGNVYEEEYESFVNDGEYSLLFGKGYDASKNNKKMSGASIYTRLIYDYGIVGTILYLCVFLSVALMYRINKQNITFILLFFASVYQRPYVLNRPYVIMYISALCFLSICADDDASSKCIMNGDYSSDKR